MECGKLSGICRGPGNGKLRPVSIIPLPAAIPKEKVHFYQSAFNAFMKTLSLGSYAGHEGSPGPSGREVLANCVQ